MIRGDALREFGRLRATVMNEPQRANAAYIAAATIVLGGGRVLQDVLHCGEFDKLLRQLREMSEVVFSHA